MAVDSFLKLDGVKGESQDAGHKDDIEILSFSWGCSQSGTFQYGGGGGAGKVNFTDVSFQTTVNKSCPVLMQKCATGEHIKKGELFVRKAGKTQLEFYKVTLTDILVTSYSASGHGEVPSDSFTLAFGKIEFEYKAQKPDGTLDAAVFGKWDVTKNVVP